MLHSQKFSKGREKVSCPNKFIVFGSVRYKSDIIIKPLHTALHQHCLYLSTDQYVIYLSCSYNLTSSIIEV